MVDAKGEAYSMVVFLVKHDRDDTDGLASFIDGARFEADVEDYDLAVDVTVTEDFTLDFTGDTVYLRRYPDGIISGEHPYRHQPDTDDGLTCPECKAGDGAHYMDCPTY